MNLLIVTYDADLRDALNQVLQVGSLAVTPGCPTMGCRFDDMLLIDSPIRSPQARDWFETACLTRIKPGTHWSKPQ